METLVHTHYILLFQDVLFHVTT